MKQILTTLACTAVIMGGLLYVSLQQRALMHEQALMQLQLKSYADAAHSVYLLALTPEPGAE